MNITFLIGNGFDLSCGLRTSYADVYEKYVTTPSATAVIEGFKRDLELAKEECNWGTWADFELGMASYAQTFSNEKEFIECIVDFKKFLKSHLAHEEEIFNKRLLAATEKASNRLMSHIIHMFRNFSRGTSAKYQRIGTNTMNQDAAYQFVSFNYTKVFDKIAAIAGAHSQSISHVHGSLVDGNITLGVDDASQIQKNFTLTKKGKRMFVKTFFNNEEDPEKVLHIKRTIALSNYIFAFGLSFGDSDLTWKNAVIQWLRDSVDHHLFLYDCECARLDLDDVALKRNAEEDRKVKILKEKGFCDENDSIFDQIHIPVGNILFNIDEIFLQIESQQIGNQ